MKLLKALALGLTSTVVDACNRVVDRDAWSTDMTERSHNVRDESSDQLQALCAFTLQANAQLLANGAFHAPNRGGFEIILGTYIQICQAGFSKTVCEGVLPEKTEHVYQAVQKNLATITAEQISNAINGECFKDHSLMNLIDIEVPKVSESYEKVKFIRYNPNKRKIKVAHLTDIHLDFDYAPGSSMVCEEIMCCRADSTPNMAHAANAAGVAPALYWGSPAACDIPYRTFTAALDAIKAMDVDAIVYTGDGAAHNIWNFKREDGLKALQNITDTLVDYFPDIPIFPAVGNHDTIPLDFVTDDFSWYQNFADNWKKFGLSEEAQKTLATGGYYVQEFPTPSRNKYKFKVIAVNAQYCYTDNVARLHGDYGFDAQNKWLVSELEKARAENAKVLVLSHILPGNYQFVNCAKAFYEIISQFKNTVTAVVGGHEHQIAMRMFLGNYKIKQANVQGYVAPALTTWIGGQPGFQVYEIDSPENRGSTYGILGYKMFEGNIFSSPDEPLAFEEKFRSTDFFERNAPRKWRNFFRAASKGKVDRIPNGDEMMALYMKYYEEKMSPADDALFTQFFDTK